MISKIKSRTQVQPEDLRIAARPPRSVDQEQIDIIKGQYDPIIPELSSISNGNIRVVRGVKII